MKMRWVWAVVLVLTVMVTGGWGATVVPAVTTSVSPKTGGTISPERWEFQQDQTQEFTVHPAEGYEIKKLLVNGVADVNAVGKYEDYSFVVTPDPLKKNKVAVTLAKRKLTLTVNPATGGTIAPKTIQVLYGTSKKFTFTPQAGNVIGSVTLDDVDVTSQLVGKGKSTVKSLDVSNVKAAHTLTATFVPKAQVSALKLAEKVSVVDAKAGSPSLAVKPLRAPSLVAENPTDYDKDVTRVYVDERSMDAFNSVNEILCMIGQTRYESMLNKGDYKAQINVNVCRGGKETTQQDASSSAAPVYTSWTVNSSRLDNASPQVVKAWVHETEEKEQLIMARLEVTEAPSETNPYGLFSMRFVGYPAANGVATTSTPKMKGYLRSEVVDGKVQLTFSNDEARDGKNETRWVTLSRNSDGMSGQGTLGDGLTTSNIAFDPSLFRRDDLCFDRYNFEESAWRYALYDAENGSRLLRNSGFSVRKVVGAKTYYGWVGYWGLWFPNDVTLANGDELLKENPENRANPTAYTVVKADGKLKKHTRHTTTLGAIKNLPLQMWIQSEMGNARVTWNGTSFMKDAVMTCGQNGCGPWQDVTPAPVDLSALTWDELSFWSQSLGGQARVKLTCTPNQQQGQQGQMMTFSCSANDDLAVVYYAEDIVYPDDTVPATLACYDNCPAVTADGITGATGNGQTSTEYTFDRTNMLLKKDGNPAVKPLNSDSFMSGPLFDPTDETVMAKLNCGWQWNPSAVCGWKAWSELDSFYTWETGTQDWNKFVALKSKGDNPTILKFDPPLQVSYVHEQADETAPDYKYNGTKFFLDYSGFGELQGIPGKCVNMDTGAVVNDCSSDNNNTRWVAEYTIANGATVSADGKDYLVKALEKSQRMKRLESGCESLDIVTFPAPTTPWTDPALGAEPKVDASPAVIGGIVQ